MTNKFFAFLLLGIFVTLYLVPLQTRPLFIQDETRYAEVPREMNTSGDWVVPRINGLRYFEKPVMGYWLTALSYRLLGENNFAVRFPSALTTGLTALLIFFLCSRGFGSGRQLPWLAVLVYLTSLGVTTLGTFAVLDPPLTLFLTATLVLFFLASEEEPGSSREGLFLFVVGIVAGCAFLTKGFLAFAVPVLTAGPYLFLQRRWRDTLRMLGLPIAGAVLVSLPWALLIQWREPDFWHYFFWNEHVRRFLSDSAQHSQPFWFFTAVLPAMFMPWVLLGPASVFGAWRAQLPRGPQRRLIIFALCWFLFPFLFFSASRGKLITYILPCFAPLSILFAYGLSWWLEQEKIENKYLQWGVGALLLVAAIALPTLTGLQLFGPDQLHLFHRSRKWLMLSGGIAAMIMLLVVAFRVSRGQQKVVLFALSFTMLLFTGHFTIPAMTLNMKAPGPLISRHAWCIDADTVILSGEEVARAVCWYLHRDDVYLVERAGELQYGLNYDDGRRRKLSPSQAGALIRKHRGRAVLIAGHEEYSRWQPFLPSPVSIDSSGRKGYLLLHY